MSNEANLPEANLPVKYSVVRKATGSVVKTYANLLDAMTHAWGRNDLLVVPKYK